MSEECQQKARKDVSIKDIPSIGTDPLRYCLNNKLVDQDGLWLEFGVHEGQTIDLISRFTKNDVYGFDTFSGLDAPWLGTETKSMLVFDIGGKEGCIIVFDELVNYKSYHEHEIKAFKEFVLENNVTFEWIGSTSDIMHSDQIEQAYIKLQGKPQRRVCHDRSVACKILSMS